MRSIAKLIRRCMGILLISTVLVFVLNIILFLIVAAGQVPGDGPWTVAEKTAAALKETESGWTFSEEMEEELEKQGIWAMYIDDYTLQVKWHTEELPEGVPMEYTATDISNFTRGYLAGSPVFTAEAQDGKGLVAVGFPEGRYWKHMRPAWDYDLIKNSPYIVLGAVGANLLLVFLIYVIANTKLLRSVRPLVEGIQALPSGTGEHIKEKGLLLDLAKKINQASEILRAQKAELRKRESARANWISGVSHDIRTPLSMVMGYAGQMEGDMSLSEENRRKATVIRQQSLKIKNLVNDLNLASKLEYHMQPLTMEKVSLVAVARQCAADFINADVDGRYTLEWNGPETESVPLILGDKDLLVRAVTNLLNNVQSHNPDGCRVCVEVCSREEGYAVAVEDDGIGIREEELEKLKSIPHYMMSDGGTEEPRHGLGLLIVQQIAAVHGGEVAFKAVSPHGLRVEILFKRSESEKM